MSQAEGTGAVFHLDDASCADLALHLAPEDVRATALAHAATCPACEARLRAHVSAGARARADWRERRPRLVRSRRRWPIGLAAAAVLAVAVAVPWLRLRGGAPAPREDGLPALGDLVQTRDGGTADAHFIAGLEAWRAHDAAKAERELSAAQVAGPTEQARRLYLADVKLSRGDARGAVALLRDLEWRAIPEPWRRTGVTLYARALRRVGDRDRADSLERMRLESETPFVP